MHLTLDLETRSRCELKKHGSWVYSEDPSTAVICAAVKADDLPPAIWFPRWVWAIAGDAIKAELKDQFILDFQLFHLIEQAEVIESHNQGFETPMWVNVLAPRYGWPSVPFDKLRCSMAKCAYHAIPQSLDMACRALGLEIRKDAEGAKIMMSMCKPRKPTKNNPAEWNETPEQIVRLARYCMADVNAEHALSQALADLPHRERLVWKLDQLINRRGILTDVPTARRMVSEISKYEDRLLDEVAQITSFSVRTVKQIGAAQKWLASQGVALPNLTKSSVLAALGRPDLPSAVRRFLEIRRSLGRSSTSKYQAIVDRASKDRRVRGTMLYHGAATGRFSSRGIQLQNVPRGTIKDVDECILAVNRHGFDWVETLWGDPMAAASSCLRGMLMAKPGHRLFVSDFSSIEARVLAWIAGEEETLRAFRDGRDLYKVAASGIFNVAYDSVDKNQRSVGKVSTLALGYVGGIGAYSQMAKGYGVDLETLPAHVFPSAPEDVASLARRNAQEYLKRHSGLMSEDAATACDIIKQLWRRANPNIVALWAGLEEAVNMAVAQPGQTFGYNGILYKIEGRFLKCRLPSGRKLHYCDPTLEEKETPWGQMKLMTTYWAVNSMTNKWEKCHISSGIATENIVQAASRDLMVEAALRLEAKGYPLILHVHDEIVAEVPDGFGSIEEFDQIMAEVPAWATGCPIGAEGFTCNRYRK
jgi:DNA polymerase